MPKDQTELTGEGFQRPVIKSIENAAAEYVARREKFQKASEACQEAKTKLLEVMQANSDKLDQDGNGSRIYRYDDELVILTEKANVKVKNAVEDQEDDED
jgi:hypothetical protein